MIKNVLFDLDGTLTNSSLGITNSFIYALKKFNIDVKDRKELEICIGPPLLDSFMNVFGFDVLKAEMGVSFYREYFKDKGLFENEVYPNIELLLKTLKEKGYRLLISTSKPDVFTVRILEHFNLLQYFDYISAATIDGSISKKGDIIRNAINGLNLKREETIMVGDRKHDIIGAHENGIKSIGVLYGFGSFNELKDAKATYIAKDVLDILNYL